MTTPESKEKCCDAPKADWHRDCNYQRGFSDGFNDEGNSIHREAIYQRGLAEGAREGKRALLEPIVFFIEQEQRVYGPDPYVATLAYLRALLSTPPHKSV